MTRRDESWGRCARCGIAQAVIPRYRTDHSVSYALCLDCHRDVRYWSCAPEKRKTLKVRPERLYG